MGDPSIAADFLKDKFDVEIYSIAVGNPETNKIGLKVMERIASRIANERHFFQINGDDSNLEAVIRSMINPVAEVGSIFEDIFYPDNPARRAKLEQNIGALTNNLMIECKATNDLVEIINTHLKADIQHVTINDKDTLKENAKRMVDCINKIDTIIKEKVKQLKEKLDPKMFEKLMNVSVSFEDKIKVVEDVVNSVAMIGDATAAIYISTRISSITLLEPVVECLGESMATVVSNIVLSVFSFGIDAVAEAIIGAVEREKLNEEIDKTNKFVAEMQEQTTPYITNVEEIKVQIEYIKKKNK